MAGKSYFWCRSASFTSPGTEPPPQSGWVAAGLAPSEWACGRFPCPCHSRWSLLSPPLRALELEQQRLHCAACTKWRCSNTERVWNNPTWLGWKVCSSGAHCLPWALAIPLMRILICSSHQSQGTAMPTLLSQPRFCERERRETEIYSTLFQVLTETPKLFDAENNQKADMHFVDCVNICSLHGIKTKLNFNFPHKTNRNKKMLCKGHF